MYQTEDDYLWEMNPASHYRFESVDWNHIEALNVQAEMEEDYLWNDQESACWLWESRQHDSEEGAYKWDCRFPEYDECPF